MIACVNCKKRKTCFVGQGNLLNLIPDEGWERLRGELGRYPVVCENQVKNYQEIDNSGITSGLLGATRFGGRND